ncbi:hypothetical protein M0813_01730 [Anaeramoeba flamelloides]|uniref:Uncharacterized protein n=1 Tax=Anaeramoeba flamelloides TaxID=1746091 RepID=A0ABQ8YX51_9EUKA|nr:hypothetical protein M0813_01730 [Anaeramoeba flamelloides]
MRSNEKQTTKPTKKRRFPKNQQRKIKNFQEQTNCTNEIEINCFEETENHLDFELHKFWCDHKNTIKEKDEYEIFKQESFSKPKNTTKSKHGQSVNRKANNNKNSPKLTNQDHQKQKTKKSLFDKFLHTKEKEELKKQNKQLNKKKKELQHLNLKLKGEMSLLESSNNVLRSNLKKFRNKLKKNNKENEELKKKIETDKNNLIDENTQRISNLNNNFNQLTTTYDKLKESLGQLPKNSKPIDENNLKEDQAKKIQSLEEELKRVRKKEELSQVTSKQWFEEVQYNEENIVSLFEHFNNQLYKKDQQIIFLQKKNLELEKNQEELNQKLNKKYLYIHPSTGLQKNSHSKHSSRHRRRKKKKKKKSRHKSKKNISPDGNTSTAEHQDRD